MKQDMSSLSENELIKIINTGMNTLVFFFIVFLSVFTISFIVNNVIPKATAGSFLSGLFQGLLIGIISMIPCLIITVSMNQNKLSALIELLRRTKVLTLSQGKQELQSIIPKSKES